MKLFISKSKEDAKWLTEFCADNDWSLEAESMISFSAMDFQIPSDAEIIFFSSKNGVRYFLDQGSLPEGIKVACIGRETARVLRKHNIEPDYIGDKSGQPEVVGKDFVEFAAGRKIFFPTSNASLHTVANMFPDEQKTISSIYETKLSPKKINDVDVYIFSSPSNVKGFLETNTLPKDAKIVAWGNVTESALADKEFFSDYVLVTAQKEELMEYLATL